MTGQNKLKARLKAGETVTAGWLELGSPDVAEIIVHSGWDVVVVDAEHGVAGVERAFELIRAVEAAGGEAVLRVPEATDAILKRALDRGARSILAPMVNSVAEAKRIAHACLYPPRGGRGYAAPITRAANYGARTDYAATAHEELLLMLQIEHKDAVPLVSEYGKIEGVDMVFIGPNDLSGSYGMLGQLTAEPVKKAMESVEADAKAAGLMLGIITGAGRDWGALRDAGYNFIIGPNDIAILAQGFRAARVQADDDLKA